MLLTSIADIITQADLMDRALLIEIQKPTQYCTEVSFWEQFDEKESLILGAILDLLVKTLQHLPDIPESNLPRMAEFGKWGLAVERAMGWPDGTFRTAYDANRQHGMTVVLDESLIYPPLLEILDAHGGIWAAPASTWLKELGASAGPEKTRLPGWPKAANFLSGQLKRLKPALASVGITVTFGHADSTHSHKQITIHRFAQADKVSSGSSASSGSTPVPETPSDGPDGPDDGSPKI